MLLRPLFFAAGVLVSVATISMADAAVSSNFLFVTQRCLQGFVGYAVGSASDEIEAV